MPNWKKVIVSGSNAILSNITASGDISASGDIYATNFIGTASLALTSSYILGSNVDGAVDLANTANVATSASYLNAVLSTTDFNYPVPFTEGSNDPNYYTRIYNDSKGHFTYNPSTNTLRVGGIIQLSGSIDFKNNNGDLVISGSDTLDMPVGAAGSLNIFTSSIFDFNLANNAQNIDIGINNASAVNLGANSSITTVYNLTAAGSNIRALNLPSNTVNADSVVMWKSSTGYFYYTASDALGGGNQNLQQVTEQGSSTTIPITASIISASGDITGDDFNIKGNANITGIIDVLTDNDNLSYLTQTAFVRADDWDAERHIVLWRPDLDYYTPVGMLGTGVEGTWNSNKGYRFYLTNQAGGAPSASQHLAILQNGDVEIDYKSSEQAYNLSGSAKLYVNGNISTTSHITASGNISASGDIYGRNLFIDGNITAEQYIINSTVTNVTMSFSSGSTIFGDSLDDTHLFTGSVDITGSLTVDGITYPTTDGDNGDVLITDGAGNLSFTRTTVYANVKNVSGGELIKGMPVHVTGTAGNTSEVIAASASNADTMPAHFILNETLADNAEGLAIAVGYINGVNTIGFTEGDTVYVAADGGYTNVKPTSDTNLIQNLGIVDKVAENGSGFILGAGRSNDVPNLPVGKIWVGSSTYSVTSSVIHLDESNNRLGINTDNPTYQLHVSSSTAALGVYERAGGAALYLEGQETRGVLGTVGSHPLLIAYNSGEVARFTGTSFLVTGSLDVSTSITASGNISASGYVSADSLILNVTSSLSGSEDPYFISFNRNENYKEGVLKRTFDKTNLNSGDPGYDLRGEQICSVSTDIAIIEAQYRIMIYGCTVSDSGGPFLLEATSSIASTISFNPNSPIQTTPTIITPYNIGTDYAAQTLAFSTFYQANGFLEYKPANNSIIFREILNNNFVTYTSGSKVDVIINYRINRH